MKRLLLVTLALVACHDDPKPAAVPLPESTASAVDPVAARSPALAPAVSAAEIVIDVTQITVRGSKLIDLPSDRTNGADAKDKRNGRNDLYLVALANAYSLDAGRTQTSMTIDVDDTTPYRLLTEVLFTLGQVEFTHWDLRRRGHEQTLAISPRRYDPSRLNAGSLTGIDLSVLQIDGGISVKTSGGNLMPGCDILGAGLAVPKRDNKHDYAALTACLTKVKITAPSERGVVFSTSPSTPFADVWTTLEVVRGGKRELFPDVQLGISR
jgi:hypothetical protein